MSALSSTSPVADSASMATKEVVSPDLGKVSLNIERLLRNAVSDWRVNLLSESFLRAVSDDRVKDVVLNPISKLVELGVFTLSSETKALHAAPGNSVQFISSLLGDLKIGLLAGVMSRQLPPKVAPIIGVLSKLQSLGSIEAGDARTRAKVAAKVATFPETIVEFAKKIVASDKVKLTLTAPMDAEKAAAIDLFKKVCNALLFTNPIPDKLVAELVSRSSDAKSRAKLLGAEELDLSGLVREMFEDKDSYTRARLANLPSDEQMADLLGSMMMFNNLTSRGSVEGAMIVFSVISTLSEFLSEATTLVASIESDLIFDGAESKKAKKTRKN